MRINPQDTSTTLTERQTTIVQMLSHGKGMKQIAHELGISRRTVENHVAADRTTAGTQNVTALVATSIRNGWI